jgi:anti-sigma regulatory factor (Ser/Thr protein kinase)
METRIQTLERQLESARTTIESQARQLESAHLKAWEIEKLVIELGNQLGADASGASH